MPFTPLPLPTVKTKVRPVANQSGRDQDLLRTLNALVHTANTPYGPFYIEDGTVTAPGLGFQTEPGLGIRRVSTGVGSLVSTGHDVLLWGYDANGAAVSIGTGLALAGLKVSKVQTGNAVAHLEQLGTGASDDGLRVTIGSALVGTRALRVQSGVTDRFVVNGDGSAALAATVDGLGISSASALAGTNLLRVVSSAVDRVVVHGDGTVLVGTLITLDGVNVRAGIGIVPTVPLHVSRAVAGAVSILQNTSAAAGSAGVSVQTASVLAADPILQAVSGGVVRFAVNGDGSLTGKANEALAKAPQTGVLSAGYTLTTTLANLAGCSVTLSPGVWGVCLAIDFIEAGAGDVGAVMVGLLAVSSGAASILNGGTPGVFTPQIAAERLTVTKVWTVTVTATAVIQGQARKLSGTGTSNATVNTTIDAWYVGNP